MTPNALTLAQAAEQLGVSTKTLKRWIDAGHIRAFKTRTGGHWRLTEQAVSEYVQRQEHRYGARV